MSRVAQVTKIWAKISASESFSVQLRSKAQVFVSGVSLPLRVSWLVIIRLLLGCSGARSSSHEEDAGPGRFVTNKLVEWVLGVPGEDRASETA